MSTLNLDKETLWICPKCKAENIEIAPCAECDEDNFKPAFNRAVLRRTLAEYKENLSIGLGCGLFALLVFGFPIFTGTFSFLYDRYNPPAPTPAPTPLITSEIEDAIQKYVSANWSGWKIAAYDDASADDDKTDVVVYLEKDNHLLKIKLTALFLETENGKVRVAVPDVVTDTEY